VDDAFDVSHGVELDPVPDGDLIPELSGRVFEQATPQVAFEHPRALGGIGADRDLFSQDLEDGSDECRRDRFHGEEGSML
jgi:hypothetical protein